MRDPRTCTKSQSRKQSCGSKVIFEFGLVVYLFKVSEGIVYTRMRIFDQHVSLVSQYARQELHY